MRYHCLQILTLLVLQIYSIARATDQDFEVISDVDYGFIMGQPKIPWGEDPFLRIPGFAPVPSTAEKFTLGGVMFSRRNPSAVVNGKLVLEGDRIGGRMVKKIGPNYVILKRKHSEVELTLPPVTDDVPDGVPYEDEDEEQSQ
ncbi:MAG: hypothetical protein KGP28_00550 [Bdellovibrionales bacterium]|nr:hypothetical protein [Bdellovibrionales bacterium]